MFLLSSREINAVGCVYFSGFLKRQHYYRSTKKSFERRLSNRENTTFCVLPKLIMMFQAKSRMPILDRILKQESFLRYVHKIGELSRGDPRALFSIANTLRCRGGRYSIPWIAPLYPWSLPYNARRRQVPFFVSLVWLDLGLNPWSPEPLANTLLIKSNSLKTATYWEMIAIFTTKTQTSWSIMNSTYEKHTRCVR